MNFSGISVWTVGARRSVNCVDQKYLYLLTYISIQQRMLTAKWNSFFNSNTQTRQCVSINLHSYIASYYTQIDNTQVLEYYILNATTSAEVTGVDCCLKRLQRTWDCTSFSTVDKITKPFDCLLNVDVQLFTQSTQLSFSVCFELPFSQKGTGTPFRCVPAPLELSAHCRSTPYVRYIYTGIFQLVYYKILALSLVSVAIVNCHQYQSKTTTCTLRIDGHWTYTDIVYGLLSVSLRQHGSCFKFGLVNCKVEFHVQDLRNYLHFLTTGL